ncbi:OmpP1/FadL family transporter [Psychroflexus salis]|uniref:Aromatic hydrocarbon degradation protein n=1 Tax=Psychroflexus salis TaxID=1526574 RepID=A0A916ZR51_9FLAO|nr:outer membrane protein transport protein [Psychroflexus salis]GGE08167.1 aromatic hydrocarbon degradation protein [Psychroflexus salis]
MKKLVLSSLLFLAFASAYAGGYRVGAQGQRALAMGHSGVAVVSNAELAFFNPSGLIHLENRLNISAGVTGVFSNVRYQNSNTGQFTETDSAISTPFYLNASYKINDWLAAGISVSTPYGSQVEWPRDWAGSHLVNEIELAAIFVQPLVSIKINDYLSVGGGPIFVTGSVNFNRNLTRSLVNEEGARSNVEIDDSGITNWGWGASFMFTPSDKLTIGFNYRSEIMMNAEGGEATFTNVPNSPAVPAQNGVVPFNASLPLPAEWSLGASYQFSDKFMATIEYNRTLWNVYESLDINFPSGAPSSINPRNYKDASIYRIGAQYEVTNRFTLRGGYYLDESPVQAGYFAPETPRNDAMGFTGGFSFDVSEKFAVDFSFLYLRFDEVDASYDFYSEDGQEIPFGGTYKSNAFLPGLGITYKL